MRMASASDHWGNSLFSFQHCDNKTKRGVEFRQLLCDVLHCFSTLLYAGYSVKSKKETMNTLKPINIHIMYIVQLIT